MSEFEQEPNCDLLDATLEEIQEMPEFFEYNTSDLKEGDDVLVWRQDIWGMNVYNDLGHECGTAACLAGHLAIGAGLVDRSMEPIAPNEDSNVAELATHLLNLPKMVADRFYNEENTMPMLLQMASVLRETGTLTFEDYENIRNNF
jgi:hypothetical protein